MTCVFFFDKQFCASTIWLTTISGTRYCYKQFLRILQVKDVRKNFKDSLCVFEEYSSAKAVGIVFSHVIFDNNCGRSSACTVRIIHWPKRLFIVNNGNPSTTTNGVTKGVNISILSSHSLSHILHNIKLGFILFYFLLACMITSSTLLLQIVPLCTRPHSHKLSNIVPSFL